MIDALLKGPISRGYYQSCLIIADELFSYRHSHRNTSCRQNPTANYGLLALLWRIYLQSNNIYIFINMVQLLSKQILRWAIFYDVGDSKLGLYFLILNLFQQILFIAMIWNSYIINSCFIEPHIMFNSRILLNSASHRWINLMKPSLYVHG